MDRQHSPSPDTQTPASATPGSKVRAQSTIRSFKKGSGVTRAQATNSRLTALQRKADRSSRIIYPVVQLQFDRDKAYPAFMRNDPKFNDKAPWNSEAILAAFIRQWPELKDFITETFKAEESTNKSPSSRPSLSDFTRMVEQEERKRIQSLPSPQTGGGLFDLPRQKGAREWIGKSTKTRGVLNLGIIGARVEGQNGGKSKLHSDNEHAEEELMRELDKRTRNLDISGHVIEISLNNSPCFRCAQYLVKWAAERKVKLKIIFINPYKLDTGEFEKSVSYLREHEHLVIAEQPKVSFGTRKATDKESQYNDMIRRQKEAVHKRKFLQPTEDEQLMWSFKHGDPRLMEDDSDDSDYEPSEKHKKPRPAPSPVLRPRPAPVVRQPVVKVKSIDAAANRSWNKGDQFEIENFRNSGQTARFRLTVNHHGGMGFAKGDIQIVLRGG